MFLKRRVGHKLNQLMQCGNPKIKKIKVAYRIFEEIMAGTFTLLNERYKYKNTRSLMKCYLGELNGCIPCTS